MKTINIILFIIAVVVSSCSKENPTKPSNPSIDSVTAAERCIKAIQLLQIDTVKAYCIESTFKKWAALPTTTNLAEVMNLDVMGSPYRDWVEFVFEQPSELDEEKSTDDINYVKLYTKFTDNIQGTTFYRGIEMKMVIDEGEWKCENITFFYKKG